VSDSIDCVWPLGLTESVRDSGGSPKRSIGIANRNLSTAPRSYNQMKPPQLFPAIDIRDGKAVRLLQGDYDRQINFDMTPVVAGERWEAEGAKRLHVVDLDGALTGVSKNLAHIADLVQKVNIPVQLGGGLRTPEAVRAVLDVGVERVVLGTAAIKAPEFLDQMITEFGKRIVVSIDVRDGRVAIDGWTDTSGIFAGVALRDMEKRGVETVIYTPIEVDGLEQGPKLDALRQAASETAMDIIYASGVGRIEHLRELASLRLPNLRGVIVGTALYKENFGIKEAHAALGSPSGHLAAA
jgi:phosphoribosylformimino-5-aminoimidazole carboxamide ribotide isomerase